ncbi:MAG: DNA methyltransferase [Isosphaeraceae bacterium]
MARDPELIAHQEWLGYLQPVGLVVSPPALTAAGAYPNKNIIPDHARFLDLVEQVTVEGKDDPQPAIRDFPRFATQILGWEPADLLGSPDGDPVPETLEMALPEYSETLRPSYAVPEFSSNQQPATSNSPPWLMLIQRVKLGLDLDETPETDAKDHCWQASPQARFERLLRETQVPIGLLSNGTHLRLVYAPRGETSGHLTFPVQAMTEVAGRPIFAALQMLLSAERLFTLPDKQRLPYILSESRKYQNLVSTKLAEQVLAALYELLRGFQAADDQRHGELLRDVLKDDPNQVYAGLLRVLLRLVFILYAEDRSLLSNDEVYQKYYSVIGLFERLREDAGRYTDTMDHRFGAWAQLLTLFRLIYDGGRHGTFQLPARKGYLFDPGRYPFLEGRGVPGSWLLVAREDKARTDASSPIQELATNNQQLPRLSDGVVFRVLQNLLILDGERLSYRTLDVEQIGSVYETMMGFNLEVAQGRSIAIKPTKPHGAPTTINLEALLAAKPADRARWLKEQSDQAVTGQAAAALKEAATPEDAVAALERKVSFASTPRVVPAGAMVLQPSDELRRSGSHYTPRTLTEPIVETTFRPILERLGPNPTPEQILDLKVCDPAMGSGAFLVAACRFLADLLVRAWHAHNAVPKDIPPDQDEILYARRSVAQRCLYGVDKNPMAVDLAKLSLWLATLAKDHPFTFLDHALKCGDSLVGLTKAQILGFHWKPEKQRDFARAAIEGQLGRALEQRRQIREAPDGTSEVLLQERLQAADGFLNPGRRYGDLVVSAFFAADNDRKRKERLESLSDDLAAQRSQFDVARHQRLEAAVGGLRRGPHPVFPFHWEIEFPEVFDRYNPGFDAFVGNPPFAGKNTLASGHAAGYPDWLKMIHEESHGNADLVAHFFRRAFDLLRNQGAFGLIATNTIGQGDTRSTGLRWICKHGGVIYAATRRKKWPGQAAVIVSVVYVGRLVGWVEPGRGHTPNLRHVVQKYRIL